MEKTITRTIATKKATVKAYNHATDGLEAIEVTIAGRSKNLKKLVPEGYTFLSVEKEYVEYATYEMPLSAFIATAKKIDSVITEGNEEEE